MALKPGQRKCIETLDRSLVVAAGAGSGKTFTLTKRVVHAIESGAVDGIERVCAITFTNKAAGELKSRIKSELRACGLAEQALKVDEAWISTIHGMCSRILKAHAIELDLDPTFKMADEELAQRLLNRSVNRVLAAAGTELTPGSDEGPSGLRWAEAVDALFAEYPARSRGTRGTSVESMLRTIMGAASSNALGFDAISHGAWQAVNPASLVQMVLDAYEALACVTRTQKPSASREAWVAAVEEQAALIRSEMEQGNAGDALWAVGALDRLPMPKKTGTADYREQVEEARELYRTCVMELRLAAAERHLDTLVSLARAAADLFAAEKRAAGVLDNDDLLVMASAAIANHPDIAAQYTDKFQLVMVDEFQDTDQMQVDMIKRLAGPGACRLCTVGDAQQSIYRFRGADVSVYRRHLESVRSQSPDDVIPLPDNFRSHPDVLALVDRVFERPEMFGGEFMSLAPGRDEARVKRPFASGVPRVQVQLTSGAYQGASSAQLREVAAARLADAFATLREKGHSAGEMAILLGGMTYADVYAAALRERGFACVIAGGSVFSQSPEAQMVLDLARVAANPYHTQSLCNVLTGPLFELGADDLLRISTRVDGTDGSLRRSNLYTGFAALARQLREEGPGRDWSPQIVLALRVMDAFIGGAGRSRVSRIVSRAVEDSGLLSRLQAMGPEGLARAGNVYKAIRMLESIETASASGPARTARLFQVLLDESKEAPGALSATGGDFVRIMTVHASKGLEFPIVAVAEFRDSASRSPKLLESEIGGKVYLSLDLHNSLNALDGPANLSGLPALYASMMDGCSDEGELASAIERADGALSLRAALYEYERVGDEEESKRLLYVALTRAKEALVVSARGTSTKGNPQAVPKSCLGQVVSALAGSEGGFDAGISHADYQGSASALVEHVTVEKDEQQNGVDDAVDAGSEGDAPIAFAIPAEPARPCMSRVPYAPAHDGVFSYSSIAEASHEGDVLETLAQAAFVSADEAVEEFGSSAISGEGPSYGALDFGFDVTWANRNASVADEDDGSWAYVGASCADADKATDLGTAFHRLAQYAVVVRGRSGALASPPVERIAALARAGRLDDVQRARLDGALRRWFGSDIAARMDSFADLRAEVPFFAKVPGDDGRSQAFLEGEIDLMGLRPDGQVAVVVDYKTGGRAGESSEELRLKHVLQASCYAYAIMLQGVREVEAVFVRVERPRGDDPSQPQCVRYRFSASDLPMLAAAIAEVHNRMRA